MWKGGGLADMVVVVVVVIMVRSRGVSEMVVGYF